MRIYLDVSCPNRPFDDQSQERVRLEAEAVRSIIDRMERGEWEQASSEIAEIEVAAISDSELRRSVARLLPRDDASIKLDPSVMRRAEVLESLGLKLADALHVAAAEQGAVDVLLTCDDRLLRWWSRRRSMVRVRVFNPLDWLTRYGHA